VTGIGENGCAIIAGWAEQRAIREIMIFLHTTVSELLGRADIQDLWPDAVQFISEDLIARPRYQGDRLPHRGPIP